MKLRIYREGEHVRESPELIRVKKGPLFCTIEFIGDGTPGRIHYCENADFPDGPEWCKQQREKIEKLLSIEESYYLASGGQVENEGKVLFYDHWETAGPWTKEHIENELMPRIDPKMIVRWDEDERDRLIQSFPPRNNDSPRRVRSCRNKHLFE